MGDLYSVYVLAEMPADARAFFAEEFGVPLSDPGAGRWPTRSEVTAVLDALPGCEVRYSDSYASSQADVQRTDDPAEWATLVWLDGGPEFYFSKSTLGLMQDILTRLTPATGALLLHPHTGDLVVLCQPEAAPEVYREATRPTSVASALDLLTELGAVPHLIRHHRLVAEAAEELCNGLAESSFGGFDPTEVLVGAALHDVGKIAHPEEMHGGGNAHERVGYRLLLDQGVPEHLARHAWTHAGWSEQDELEPLLVALADKLWKGKRVPALEEKVTQRLAAAVGREFWEAFTVADSLFEGIAAGGDERLARSRVGGQRR